MKNGRPKDVTQSKYDYTKLIEAFKEGREIKLEDFKDLLVPAPKFIGEHLLMNIELPIFETRNKTYKLLTMEEIDKWQSMN